MTAGSAIQPLPVTSPSYARWPSTWSAKTAPPKAAFVPSVRRPLGTMTICSRFSGAEFHALALGDRLFRDDRTDLRLLLDVATVGNHCSFPTAGISSQPSARQ